MAYNSNMPVYLYGNISLSNADRYPMWSTMNSNQQEYYEVEVFDDRNVEGEKLKNMDAILNMTTKTCHICKIDVPKAFIKEHINSVKHESCLKITNIALERTHLYMKSDLFESSVKLKVEGTYFCEHCATIVQTCDTFNHIQSRSHLNSVENDTLLQKLVSAYQDKDFQTGIGVDIDSFHLTEDNLQQMNSKFFDAMSSEFVLDVALKNEPNIKENDYMEDGKEVLKSTSVTTGFSAENICVSKKKKRRTNPNLKKLNENKITDDHQMTSKKGEQCVIESTSSECNLAKTSKKTDEEKTDEDKQLKEEFQIKESKEMYVEDNKVINKKKATRNKAKQNMKDLTENTNTENSEIIFGKDEQNEEKKNNEKDTQNETTKQSEKEKYYKIAKHKQNEKDKLNENDILHEEEQQNEEKKQNEKNNIDEKDKQCSKESSIRWGITEEVGTKTHDNLSIYLEFLSIRNETLKVKALTESIVELKVEGGEKAAVPLLHFHGYDLVGDGAIVCRICRGIGLVNAKEHRWDDTHISKIMSPVDKHFMRQLDDTLSHCILCNTLHLTAETQYHVAYIVHKVNRQTRNSGNKIAAHM